MRLTVTIANSDTTDVTVPATVTIPAGATSVTFAVGTINTQVADGTQTATLTASATGEASGSATLTVTNVNAAHADRRLEQSYRERDRHQSGNHWHGDLATRPRRAHSRSRS